MDFVQLYTNETKNKSKNREAGSLELVVDFKVFRSKDLMVRGKSFYAIYDDRIGKWIKNELAVVDLVDRMILDKVRELENDGHMVHYILMQNYNSGIWTKWVSYIKNMPDNWRPLDDRMRWENEDLKRSSYATRTLPYSLVEGSIKNYDILMSTLYDPPERAKLEWAIGAILTGDSRYIQKFITLYGSAGSGKSTFLNIVQKLVEGYYISFNAKDLVGRDAFGLEIFKNNPLVAIQHDGDLSRIEDNSTLNSIISHEEIVMNEKHKAKYSIVINCFLFMGTNKPVAISDSKSGLLRRLIDVHPSGRLVSTSDYITLVQNIDFELGAIAHHCIETYKGMGADYYKKYQPKEMMFETNTLYNFVFDNALIFEKTEYHQLKQLYDMYKAYCEEVGEQYPLKRRIFRADIKTYFEEFYDVTRVDDGKQLRSVYKNFKSYLFNLDEPSDTQELGVKPKTWLKFGKHDSIFDKMYSDIPAQYANEAGTPKYTWAKCRTKLKSIDTSKLHYVMGFEPEHIVIDFDIKDSKGQKNLQMNIDAATQWPKTYAELSKSGQGVHLHYLWGGGRVDELKRLYGPDIEVKVFTGNSSLRRQLTLCNEEEILTITSGIEFDDRKGGDKLLNKKQVEDERHLRVMIKKCMNKDFHGSTKPEMDFIFTLLEEAYNNGVVYDVSDMKSAVLQFASSSTNQAAYCIDLMNKMKWSSEPVETVVSYSHDGDDSDIVFYDVEVFPNLFLIVYKMRGKGKKKIALVNPTPQEVGAIFGFKLAGFNNKRYDDHILYGAYLGYTNAELFELSQKIISKQGSVKHGFREAYSLAYTDVFDFSSQKQSLKKWEIELGLKHNELAFDWDKPLPEEYWPIAIEYCGDDVDATEAVFEARQADWMARKILADIADGTVNMTTNQLTTRIIFGNDRKPQLEYTHLEETFPGYEFVMGEDKKMHNMYRGVDVGMGGYVYAEPGMYFNVPVLDIESMHPTSIIVMNYFGVYTVRYENLKEARMAIKHNELDKARSMFDGKLERYLDDESLLDDLSYALKIALNSAYGLTSASFENAMRDKRNVNNIVALRGALFMKTLQDEIQAKGFTVAHIKTDSIKIPDATPEIIEFCKDFAKQYGYNFEHEATYEKMCLVNNAVFIAKYQWAEKARKIGKWEAVGKQFAEPYVFKTLFTQEPIQFKDYEQVKTVTSPALMFLDFNETLGEEEHNYTHVGKVGSFVPVMPNTGGGLLLRMRDDKYTAVVGTKGYRWKESDIVHNLNQEDQIDLLYFNVMVNDAVKAIEKFGDIDMLLDYQYRTINENEDGDTPIGFDDMPMENPIANAILTKGE